MLGVVCYDYSSVWARRQRWLMRLQRRFSHKRHADKDGCEDVYDGEKFHGCRVIYLVIEHRLYTCYR